MDKVEVQKHPMQVANEARKQEAFRKELLKLADTKCMILRDNLKFLHIRNCEVLPDKLGFNSGKVRIATNGGMTIAYQVPHKNSGTIRIATAVCNPLDAYSKKEGRYLAALAFSKGNTVLVINTSKIAGVGNGRFLFEAFDPIRAGVSEYEVVKPGRKAADK